jgi:hypothetical protein
MEDDGLSLALTQGPGCEGNTKTFFLKKKLRSKLERVTQGAGLFI